MASKILVLGALTGQYTAFEKVAKLHSKNNFTFAIVVGDFFPDIQNFTEDDSLALNDLLDGKIAIPIPTYFTVGKHDLPESIIYRIQAKDGEICENLFFLGKRATTKVSSGVRIVSLGGVLDPNITAGLSQDKYLPFHTEGDARALSGVHGADILLTNSWPASVLTKSHVKLPEGFQEPAAEKAVADLCSAIRPRYHFSPGDGHFLEREPFTLPDKGGKTDTATVTRFISVAAYGHASKQKSLYAFSLDLANTSSATIPAGCTPSPFSIPNKKRSHEQSGSTFSRYGSSNGNHQGAYRNKKRGRREPPPGPDECFFCLSNPNLATRFITSIGDDSYMTTAKGPLTTSTTFPSLSFPAHMLIIPLPHAPTLASLDPMDVKQSTYSEMARYKQSLYKMLHTASKGQLAAVTWELGRTGGIHVHWQFLPVKADLVRKGLVEAAFRVEAENEKLPTFKVFDGTKYDDDVDCFKVWIWSPEQVSDPSEKPAKNGDGPDTEISVIGKEKALKMLLPTDTRFDPQFGRKVMAKLLELGSRLQWQDSIQDEEEETRDAGAFKEAFKPFDFTADES